MDAGPLPVHILDAQCGEFADAKAAVGQQVDGGLVARINGPGECAHLGLGEEPDGLALAPDGGGRAGQGSLGIRSSSPTSS